MGGLILIQASDVCFTNLLLSAGREGVTRGQELKEAVWSSKLLRRGGHAEKCTGSGQVGGTC